MNKKGFTLSEILAVLVILGLIITLITPVVNNVLKDTKGKISDLTKKNLEESAKMFGQEVFLCQNNNEITNLFSKLGINVKNCGEAKIKLENGIDVTIGFLKENDYFSDQSNNCNNEGTINVQIKNHDIVAEAGSNVKCK